MDILHEVVEVYARLGTDRRRQGLVEEVHEHGLAAADVAIEIQPARQVGGDLADGAGRWLAGAEDGGEDGLFGRLEEVEAGVDNRGSVVVS